MILPDRIPYLLQQYASGKATSEEVDELFSRLRSEDPKNGAIRASLQKMAAQAGADQHYDADYWENIFLSVLKKTQADHQVPVYSLHHGKWKRWVAAAILIIGIGITTAVVLLANRQSGLVGRSASNDIKAPRTNKAVITLADGRSVSLDSLSKGLLAQQGQVKLVKLANGKVAYQKGNGAIVKLQYNTLTNPRGSMVIDMILSDGSHVWLNAGSAVTYPVAFTDNERKVSITGEAYFEVAPDAGKPFYVTKGNMAVKVLGTHFNVNAYEDETDVKVTLLEGSVKVVNGQNGELLKPGQQAVVVAGSQQSSHQPAAQIKIVNDADLDAVMAWKNGLFQFDYTPMSAVLKQLSYWYDVDIVYEASAPDIKLWGEMKRDLTLTQALEGLGKIGMNYRIEGKKLIILGKKTNSTIK